MWEQQKGEGDCTNTLLLKPLVPFYCYLYAKEPDDMRKCLLILMAATLLAGCNSEKPLRVLYWNIQNGMWDGQTDNYRRFTEWVAAQNPDICVWAESVSLYYSNTADPLPKEERFLPDGWEGLAARYGHKYIYMGGHRDDYPQVITSKYPIENVKRIVGNGKDSVVTHGAGWARINFNGKELNLVTLHTWPQRWAYGIPQEQRDSSKAVNGGDRYRRMEMEYICRETIIQKGNGAGGNISGETVENVQDGNLHVPNGTGEYWMMMGDFNAKSRVDNHFYNWPEDTTAFLVHDYIHQNTPYIDIIKEKYPNQFFTTTGGKTRIDFFYCTAPLYNKITEASVISDDYTTPVRNAEKISNFWHPSDHRPILVEFVL